MKTLKTLKNLKNRKNQKICILIEVRLIQKIIIIIYIDNQMQYVELKKTII